MKLAVLKGAQERFLMAAAHSAQYKIRPGLNDLVHRIRDTPVSVQRPDEIGCSGNAGACARPQSGPRQAFHRDEAARSFSSSMDRIG